MTELDIRHDATLVPGDPTGGRLVAWAQAAQAAHSLATSLARTSFVPKTFQGNAADATAAILLGDELGLSPLTALRSIYIIAGTPAMYARTMVALAQSHGHEIWTVETSEHKVTVAGRRRGSEHVETVTWTHDRARRAGYTTNKKYEQAPQEMLYARASAEVARKIAADVLAGIPYSVEEMELSAPEATVTVLRDDVAKKVQRRKVEKPEPVEPELTEAAPVADYDPRDETADPAPDFGPLPEAAS